MPKALLKDYYNAAGKNDFSGSGSNLGIPSAFVSTFLWCDVWPFLKDWLLWFRLANTVFNAKLINMEFNIGD